MKHGSKATIMLWNRVFMVIYLPLADFIFKFANKLFQNTEHDRYNIDDLF